MEIDREDAKDYDNIFVLENYGNKYTRIRTGKDLKGYSGTWRIEIMVFEDFKKLKNLKYLKK